MKENIQLTNFNPVELSEEDRLWACALHLSILLNFVFPLLGILTPIGIWYHQNEARPFVHKQGKELANYMLCTFALGLTLLCFITPMLFMFPWLSAPLAFIGLTLTPLALLPFWAAYNIYQGMDFRYPIPFRFFKLNEERLSSQA